MKALFDPALYQASWYSLPMIADGLIVLAIGAFVFLQNYRAISNIIFGLLCLAVSTWLFGYGWIYSVADINLARSLYRYFTFSGVCFIAVNVYAFSVVWLDLWHAQKYFVIGAILTGLGFCFTASTTDLIVPSMTRYFWGFYSHYDALGVVVFLFFIVCFFAAFGNYAYRLRRPIPKASVKQIQLILLSFCVAFTGSIDFLPKIFHLEIYPFGFLSAFFWIAVLAYSIVRYRVMDIRTVVHRTILWFLTSALFIFPVAILAFIAKDWLSQAHPIVFAFFVFVVLVAFIPHMRIVQPRIDQWFDRRIWNLSQVVKQFTDELVYLKSLEDLAKHLLQTIKRTIYPKDLFLLLWDQGSSECLVFSSEGKALKMDIKKNDGFFAFLAEFNNLVHMDFVNLDPRLEHVKEDALQYFEETRSIICIPLVLDQKLIGVINLEEKVNLKDYSASEIRFLADMRGSAAIAISNSLRLIAMQANLRKWSEELEKQVEERTRELKQAQAQLIQAEKLATIGTLAGGVAHEINNPLAAILTNAQMLLSESLNPDLKESVELIEQAADRCRIIVQQLMKYSRKSAGSDQIESVKLREVVEHTASFLRYQLEQENIAIHVSIPDDCVVMGNANEYSQIFTNLIVNSRDAVREKTAERRIDIRASKRGSAVVAEVEDNGMGIPEKNLSKIFDPFFTTKDVGKGTGLGLSIVQGIVQKYGGRIEVNSETGAGTKIAIFFIPAGGKQDGGSFLSGLSPAASPIVSSRNRE